MAETTGIAWCDMTFNPWIGCAKVSAGCANCYAERDFDKRRHVAEWGKNGTRVLTSDDNWDLPVKWDRRHGNMALVMDAIRNAKSDEALRLVKRTHFKWFRKLIDAGIVDEDFVIQRELRRQRVFCASLADVFEDWDGPMLSHRGGVLRYCVSCAKLSDSESLSSECCRASMMPMTLTDARRRLFDLIDSTPHLDWLLLTKRPENIQRMWAEKNGRGWLDDPRPNVWLGTTCENQEMADKRVPELLKCKPLASKLFLSCEPLLGPLDLQQAHRTKERPPNWPEPTRVDWVINGAESGPGARPSKLEWHESIVSQCKAAGVPVFVKQLVIDGKMVKEVGQFPASLRVQEFPA